MKICIPSSDNKGLESKVFDHFGRAPFFTLVAMESGELEIIANTDCHGGQHGQQACHHAGHLKGLGVDTVVSGGMGRGAIAGFNRAGIGVLVAAPGTVGQAVEATRNGKAQPFDMDNACGGSHRHGDGHGNCRH